MIKFSALRSEQIPDLVGREASTTAHPWTESGLRSSFRGTADCLLIHADERVVGYLVVQRLPDEAELLNLVIFSPHGSRGYGYAALLKLQHWLRASGVDKIHLEVRATNARAVALYHKAGFVQLGVRADYYRGSGLPDGNREDAILMCWNGR